MEGKCLNQEEERAVGSDHCHQILHIHSRAESLQRRIGIGHIILAGEIEAKQGQTHSGKHCAGQSVDALGIGENVHREAKQKRHRHSPVDRQIHRQLDNEIYKHQRHGHIEQAEVIEHHSLCHSEHHKQNQESDYFFGHVSEFKY